LVGGIEAGVSPAGTVKLEESFGPSISSPSDEVLFTEKCWKEEDLYEPAAELPALLLLLPGLPAEQSPGDADMLVAIGTAADR